MPTAAWRNEDESPVSGAVDRTVRVVSIDFRDNEEIARDFDFNV